jgi:hypothetical protein
VLVVGDLAGSQSVPVYVPFLLAAWGVLCWFAGLRRIVRDPRGDIRRIAEVRARSRILHPFGGGDVEREVRAQWRMSWLMPVVILGYILAVIWMFVLAFSG